MSISMLDNPFRRKGRCQKRLDTQEQFPWSIQEAFTLTIFSLPNNFCFIAVCAFPYILAFTTDSIEIRLVVNGNLVHTAVVPELQLVASRVRHRKIMFDYFCDMLASNSHKKLLQPKTKQTKTETCAPWCVVTVDLRALSLYQVQRESESMSLSFIAHSNTDLRYLTVYGENAVLDITDVPSLTVG